MIIGLTGGIGSGKSAAAAYFSDLGAAVIDTDVIAHTLTAPDGAAMPALRTAFSDHLFAADGSLDRKAMRKLVFADSAARQKLEGILHPLIAAAARSACLQAQSNGAPYVILAVPLLIETHAYQDMLDRILVIDCPKELQITRTMQRSGLSAAEVNSILAAQASRQARLAAADDLIDNSGNLAALHAQVRTFDALYRQQQHNCGNSPRMREKSCR